MWVVGVGYKECQKDPLGWNTKMEIIELGIKKVEEVKTLQTYVIDGDITKEAVAKICKELLADNIVQFFRFDAFDECGRYIKNIVSKTGVWAAEVFFKPGVMDVVGLSVTKAIKVIGIHRIKFVRTGRIYIICGDLEEEEIKIICDKCLANSLIQIYRYWKL